MVCSSAGRLIMTATSPGEKLAAGGGAACKLGHLKLVKVMFFVISVIVCLVIFYSNSNIIGRRSLFALFVSNQSVPATHPVKDLALPLPSPQPAFTRRSLIMKSVLVRPSSASNPLQVHNMTEMKSKYNIFVIYTKENYQLHVKFELFARSLLKYSSATALYLHVLTDESSAHSVDQVLMAEVQRYRHPLMYSLYNMRACAERIVDIVNAMTPYFSSTPKSYYSDSLFFLSLGLHRIADESLERAILLDCDIVFRADVRLLFGEFERFSDKQLFGLAPELTPVYRHILYRYRANYPDTDFGSPFYPIYNANTLTSVGHSGKAAKLERRTHHGYPGLNSGVVLLYLERIRHSRIYHEHIKESAVRQITSKYMFKGHLGDQDFFTLLGYEFPNLIYRLDCVWNRQLCTWWKDHGYSDVFDAYFTCKGRVKMYHGNCNARVPE